MNKRTATIVRWTVGSVLVIATLLGLILLDRRFGWTTLGEYRHPQTGKALWGKTLWDWLDLLIIPVVIFIGGLLFTTQRAREEQQLATERSQEAALQNYLDKMTDLLLENRLRESEPDAEERVIARARTLTVLRKLDDQRKGTLVRFLYEAKLISNNRPRPPMPGTNDGSNKKDPRLFGTNPVVNLDRADLTGSDLSGGILSWICLIGAILVGADLHGTFLQGADLVGAVLFGADLRGAFLGWAFLDAADLRGADLHKAQMIGADLRGAVLTGAVLTGAVLTGAKMDADTLLPDETKWTPDTDMARFTDAEHPDYWTPTRTIRARL